MYKLFFVDPSTGVILKSDGTICLKGEELDYEIEFENKEDALAEKDRLLALTPWRVCELKEVETGELVQYFNESVLNEYNRESEEYTKYLLLPWYKKLFANKPEFKYVKT